MMIKKVLLTTLMFLCIGGIVCLSGFLLAPGQVSAPKPIETCSACPVAGCASGTCHSFENIPNPDGIHEMSCPKVGCSSLECHAWDTLTTQYYQPSDFSLNLWIVVPIVLILGLIFLVRKL